MSRVCIAGLPDSGKSSFLAALAFLIWHGQIKTSLTRNNNSGVDNSYIDKLQRSYLSFEKQERTKLGDNNQIVFSLIGDGCPDGVEISLLDVSGEIYNEIWTERRFPLDLAEDFKHSECLILFISVKAQYQLAAITETTAGLQTINKEYVEDASIVSDEITTWNLGLASKQTMLVELMQCLVSCKESYAFSVNIVLSAWDEVYDKDKNMTPKEWLSHNLPLLDQFLFAHSQHLRVKLYGVSAQGCDLEDEEKVDELSKKFTSCERAYVCPEGEGMHHDLTAVISSFFD